MAGAERRESKGKAAELAGPRADYVTRCNGGDNAERAAVPDSEAHALRSLPSGIFNPRAASVNGNSAGRPAGADGGAGGPAALRRGVAPLRGRCRASVQPRPGQRRHHAFRRQPDHVPLRVL
ncbi:MAG: adenylosuccinate synthetase [Aeriscardovia sp.]|nr:adenylosuccinate synthetase [Aeriscardovia sp.]